MNHSTDKLGFTPGPGIRMSSYGIPLKVTTPKPGQSADEVVQSLDRFLKTPVDDPSISGLHPYSHKMSIQDAQVAAGFAKMKFDVVERSNPGKPNLSVPDIINTWSKQIDLEEAHHKKQAEEKKQNFVNEIWGATGLALGVGLLAVASPFLAATVGVLGVGVLGIETAVKLHKRKMPEFECYMHDHIENIQAWADFAASEANLTAVRA